MKVFLEFVQAIYEAVSDDHFPLARFGIDEVTGPGDLGGLKDMMPKSRAKRNKDAPAETQHPTKAQATQTALARVHAKEKEPEEVHTYGTERSAKEVGKLATMKAIKASRHDYVSKHAEKMHRLAADLHSHLGNHERAMRHSAAADLMKKRDAAPHSPADKKRDAAFDSRVRGEVSLRNRVARDTKAREDAEKRRPKSSISDLYKNSHH
jgi:hypothetical protein